MLSDVQVGARVTRRKTSSQPLTPLELEIMKVLWETGPANVQTVRQALPPDRRLAYTTVQTMLGVLLRKGRVRRVLKDRAYLYRPTVSRGEVAKGAIRDLVDRLFGGSAESLVVSLLETRHLDPATLARLEREVEKSLRSGKDHERD